MTATRHTGTGQAHDGHSNDGPSNDGPSSDGPRDSGWAPAADIASEWRPPAAPGSFLFDPRRVGAQPPPPASSRRRSRRRERRGEHADPAAVQLPPPTGAPLDRTPPTTSVSTPPAAWPAAAEPDVPAKRSKPLKRRQSTHEWDKEYEPSRLALRGVDGFLTRGNGEIIAWFVEPPAAWSMRSQELRERRITARALRLAELAEHGVQEIHQRVLHRPWPVQQWARNFDEWARNSPTPPLPDVSDALSWRDFVRGEQSALLRRPTTTKSVFWGVRLSARSALARTLEAATNGTTWLRPVHRVLSRQMDGVLDRELADLADELRELTHIMGAVGIGARPATAQQMEWLLWRSATLGLPALPRLASTGPTSLEASATPELWHLGDLAALVDAAEVCAEPLRDCVQVSGVVGGQRFTRYVSILSVGRMGELAIPERHLPWQVWADSLGPVEQSARIRFPDPDTARRSLDRQVSRILNQDRHITVEHGLPQPPDLREKVARATAIKNEIETDHTKLATRLEGWYRLAVSALTEEEALRSAEQIRKRYAPTIALESGEGQYRQYLEFMPHEPLSSTAYRRRMSVRLAAAGLPSVADRIGDGHGPQIAETASLSRRPVNWDMWFAMERIDKSGLTPVVGALGSGKTHLCGMLVYKAVRAGAHGIVLDPSGPLGRLADIAELAPFTRRVDLMRALPGTLNPYRVIADPDPVNYPASPAGHAEYQSDLLAVAAERKTFVADVLRMLLPWDMQQARPVRRALDKAVDVIGGSQDREPGMLIDALGDIAADTSVSAETREAAEDVARKLNELRHLPEVRLLFPQPGIDGWVSLDETRLTILTMPGIQLPDAGTDPGTWSLQQRLGVPLVHLASWLTHRLIYDAPRNVRKIVFLDEAKYLSGSGTGQMLFTRLERDTRKYNVRALIASQLPDDFLALPGFEALTHEIIVGSVQGTSAQAGALRLLRLGTDGGWETVVRDLNSHGGSIEATHDPDARAVQQANDDAPREYVMRIGDDVEIIRVDYTAATHLRHVVDVAQLPTHRHQSPAPAGQQPYGQQLDHQPIDHQLAGKSAP